MNFLIRSNVLVLISQMLVGVTLLTLATAEGVVDPYSGGKLTLVVSTQLYLELRCMLEVDVSVNRQLNTRVVEELCK